MGKRSLNAPLDPAVVAKVAAHYRHARAKHPHFADRLYFNEEFNFFAEYAKSQMKALRELVGVGKIDAETVLLCELTEVRDAYARGDRAAAVEECYDAIAVLLRMVDVLEGRQALGDPAKDDAAMEGERR